MSATTGERGILALWNDCKPGEEPDYEAWYQTEHLPERLSASGFIVGRRYESLADAPRYFTYYETETVAALTSPAYLARLDKPSDWTRRIMTNSFQNMSRTICRETHASSRLVGGFAVTVALADPITDAEGLTAAGDIARAGGVIRTSVWMAQSPNLPPTTEEKLRGRDRQIAACIIAHCGTEAAARRLVRLLLDDPEPGAEVGIYQLMMQLDARDLVPAKDRGASARA
jgi:hypothetical protein